ncbi:hypothetical protein OK016_25925 [Vibrio chagasii]|nr:hypothetical protein [Vibrio chagasii]
MQVTRWYKPSIILSKSSQLYFATQEVDINGQQHTNTLNTATVAH